MSNKKILLILLMILTIIFIIFGIYIYKQKRIEKIDIQIHNIDFDSAISVFCVEGTRYKNKKGKEVIKDYSINTKMLSTKIYVYMKSKLKKDPNYEFPSLDVFLEQYRGNKKNLDREAYGLYGNIYEKDKADFSLKFQKELEQQKSEIEKIEKWLKDGQIQKLESWLSKQEF